MHKDGSWNPRPVADNSFLKCTSCFHLIVEWLFFSFNLRPSHSAGHRVYSFKKYPRAPMFSPPFFVFKDPAGQASSGLRPQLLTWTVWTSFSAICVASPWLVGHGREGKAVKKDDLYWKQTICKQLPGTPRPQEEEQIRKAFMLDSHQTP